MKKTTSSKYLYYFFGIVFFVGIWHVFSMLLNERVMLLPSPYDTLCNAIYQLSKKYTLESIGTSFIKLLSGYLLALVVSLVLGTMAGNNENIYFFLKPFMVFLRSVPTASLIYLFIVLAGFKKAPSWLVFMISFPILYENFVVSVKNVRKEYLEAGRLDGNDSVKENLFIRLPLSAGYYLAGVISTFSLAFKTEIMAEVLTGSTGKGLGNLIQASRANDPTNLLPVFAYSLIAIVIMLIIEMVSSNLIKRITVE